MSSSITILHGNLGKDPEVFVTDSDFPIATFTLATTRRVNDQDVTDWHNIKALGKQADFAADYLHKGKEIIVFGHNETRDYEDRDGNKRYITEVVVDRFDFCGSASGEQGGQNRGSNQSRGGQGRQQNGRNQQSRGGQGRQQGGYRSQRAQGGGHSGDEVPYDR